MNERRRRAAVDGEPTAPREMTPRGTAPPRREGTGPALARGLADGSDGVSGALISLTLESDLYPAS